MNFTVLLVLVLVTVASTVGSLLRCSEKSFNTLGGVLPSSTSSSKYSICSGGVVHEVPCPKGHFFDASSQTCTMAQDSSDTAANHFEELCTDANEVQFHPHPTDCSQYIICFGLVPIEQECSEGFFFNPDLLMCDVSSNVVCGLSCPTVDDPFSPVWLPDGQLEDCARHYLCFQGTQIPFACPKNLYFDLVSTTCTHAHNSDCRVPGIYCSQNGTANVENPRSCASYYACLDGFPHFRTCAEGEYFYPVVGRCVVGPCGPSIETTTTPEPTSTTTERPETTNTTESETEASTTTDETEPTTIAVTTTEDTSTTDTTTTTVDPQQL